MLDYLILVFIILIGLGISSAIKAFKNVLSSSNSFYDKMNDEYQKANEESEDFNGAHTLVSVLKEASTPHATVKKDEEKSEEIDRADLESSTKSSVAQKRKRNSGYYRHQQHQQSNYSQLKARELKPQELKPTDNEAVVLDDHHLKKQTLISSNPPIRGAVTDFDIEFEDVEMTADIVEPTKPMVTTNTSNKNKWREAMIYKEILGKPKALR